MTSDSSNWTTLCIVGRSSGLEETHWMATESSASRLSACTPSHCGSTISRRLFSVTRKFNCIKEKSRLAELLEKKSCAIAQNCGNYVGGCGSLCIQEATGLSCKESSIVKNGIHGYRSSEIKHISKISCSKTGRQIGYLN